MKLLLRPFALCCAAIALLASLLLSPAWGNSLTDSRVNQLEFQVRSLQTQVNQLQSRSPQPASSSARPVLPEAYSTPGNPSLDQQFDNLATLAIELKQRVTALEKQVEQLVQ